MRYSTQRTYSAERNKKISMAMLKHGQRNTRAYRSWMKMKRRCFHPEDPSYKNYGGRGITICERWMDFVNFHADMGDRPAGDYSIDRINNEGNYDPANCRWATRKQQRANRRDS